MDYIKEAKELGFTNAAIMDTQKLVFKPEYRKFCEENRCGCYHVNPACPPESGTVEFMKQRALVYEKTLILQTMQSKDMDYKMAKLAHNKLTEQLASRIKESGNTDLLIMSAGPYKHHSCMSAYCVDAAEMANAVGMICWENDDNIRYFSQIMFHEGYIVVDDGQIVQKGTHRELASVPGKYQDFVKIRSQSEGWKMG